jgi:hypothetical protein
MPQTIYRYNDKKEKTVPQYIYIDMVTKIDGYAVEEIGLEK